MIFSENQRKRNEKIANFRHTGEFHDSLPLPFVEISKNILFTENVCALKSIRRTTNDIILTLPSNERYATVSSGVTLFDSSQITVPRGIDILKNFTLFVNKSNWTESSPQNASSPILRIDRAFDQAYTTEKILVPRVEETNMNLNIDDIREPLAIDNTPKPIIIEEIANIDEEKEEICFEERMYDNECKNNIEKEKESSIHETD